MIIEGKSLCLLCKKPLNKGDKIGGYPAFLPLDHKYGRFSDAAFHKECFAADPDHMAVDDMYTAYKMIRDSAPRDLKSMADIYAWEKEAYKDWPPKSGVVIFEPLLEDSEEGSFWMDADQYKDMCEMEDKHEKERKERRDAARMREREMMRYDRDDD
jgi:hypothetical protein